MQYARTFIITAIITLIFAVPTYAAQSSSPSQIKWMEFDIPVEVLAQAMQYDIKHHSGETPMYWVDLLAYGAARHFGKFPGGARCKHIESAAQKLAAGQNIDEIAADLKLFQFYRTAYGAVLSWMVGAYEVCTCDTSKTWESRYGLRAYFPLARGYNYSHFDDFGASRSYGYKRRHLGHDFMARVGTPVIAVEDGYVEALGWNQYGGWRVGVRSVDRKRYYYYAHLRRGHPFHKALQEGSFVRAGDVLGYVGKTGYSRKEDVNNIDTPHLHFGLQIIFDETQKDGYNQIWVDTYNLVRFLSKNKMPVHRNEQTKDFERSFETNSVIFD